MYMVHLQLLAQICSFSFCDLMDACEILKMEGYVSALDEEPDAEEFPPAAEAQAHSPKPELTVIGETEDEAQAHSPKPEIVNLELGWMHAFRQGSVAEPDDSPTYQSPFGETEDEAQAHSPTKAKTKGKPKTKGKAKTKGKQKTNAKAKKKAKTKPTSKAKTKGKPKTKGKAKPKAVSKAKAKPKTKAKAKAKPKPVSKANAKPKTKAKSEDAVWKIWKHCQGAKVQK